jgi:hypothetical protein
MATIGKAMTMAALEGGDYRKALSEAVRAHNTAVHRTTNQVPSDVMFGRRLRRNLPLARDAVVTIDVEEMRERDRDEKQKAKEREDRKRGAREHSLEPGDKVVTKRANKRKGESNFDPTELEVVATRRGDITMRRPDGSEMKRNITMVKKLRGNDGMTVQTAPSMDAQRPKRCVGKPQRYLNVVDHEAEM